MRIKIDMRHLIKFLLLATAWLPVVLVVGVQEYIRCKDYKILVATTSIIIIQLLVCKGIFILAEHKATPISVIIDSIENTDHDVLAFIFITVLPLVRSKEGLLSANSIVIGLVFVLLTWAMMHAGSYRFNPTLRLLGYRCYSIKSVTGTPYLFITNRVLMEPQKVRGGLNLSDFVILKTYDKDDDELDFYTTDKRN